MAGNEHGNGQGDEQDLQLAGAAPLGPGLPAPTPGQLLTELDSMRGFKKRVDKLLEELTGSDAEPVRMADDHITTSSLGTGFAEATGLHNSYTVIHEQLTALSKILSGQIGALSTAMQGANSGYQNVDDDARDRMWAIQAQAEKHYDPKLDPYAKEHGDGDRQGSPKPTGGEKDKGDDDVNL